MQPSTPQQRLVAAGVSSGGLDGSWAVTTSILNMQFCMTPRRTDPRDVHRTPSPQPSPGGRGSRVIPLFPFWSLTVRAVSTLLANRESNPSKPAERFLPLPPGEGRGEGRSQSFSLNGSWAVTTSILNRQPSTSPGRTDPRDVHRTPSPQPSPGGRGSRVIPLFPFWSPTARAVSTLLANREPNPSKPVERFLPLPPGEGRGEGRSQSFSLNGSWSESSSILNGQPSTSPGRTEALDFHRTPSPQPSPGGRGSRIIPLFPFWSPTVRAVSTLLGNREPNPSKPAEHFLPLPPGEGRGEGRSQSFSLNGSWSESMAPAPTRLTINGHRPPHPNPFPPVEGRDEGGRNPSKLRAALLISASSRRAAKCHQGSRGGLRLTRRTPP